MSAAHIRVCARARQRGVSLIELVAFIVIMSVAAVALLSMYRGILPRGVTPAEMTIANQLAQERMELILGQRAAFGYSSGDPCTGSVAAVCTDQFTPLGLYSIVVVGASPVAAWRNWAGSAVTVTTQFREVGVYVLGPDGVKAATLSAVIAQY